MSRNDEENQKRQDAWVKKIVAEAPPLSDEQRARLWVLLEPIREEKRRRRKKATGEK